MSKEIAVQPVPFKEQIKTAFLRLFNCLYFNQIKFIQLFPAVFLMLIGLNCWSETRGSTTNGNSDTTFINHTLPPKFLIPQKHQYHQTLTMKLFLSQALFDNKLKRKDNGQSEVFLNYVQALEVIRKIDNLTLGMPKIIYLVGWQYNGHDSKYPAWFEGNERLKRSRDKNSLESLKWLMKAAEKYHTTVSLHINMLDAYEDSPLWNEYVKNDIIARNRDGSLRGCEWGYPISYAQEWKSGFAQKRIDRICELLPLTNAGPVHIDAFHSWPPVPLTDSNGKDRIDLTKGPISPYLKFSVGDETEAQRKIITYWSSKGIDVTCEGVDFLRESAFEGYQPMAWWYGGLENYLKWPASYYCGGQDNSEWGKLFGSSMHGEDIVRNDSRTLSGFKEQFCLKTAVWYYLNRLNRLYMVDSKENKIVKYSDDVSTILSKENFVVMKGTQILVENEDILIPAFWLGNNALLAYSKNGYKNRSWELPAPWGDLSKIRISRITTEGKTVLTVDRIVHLKLSISLEKDEMVLIERL